jgi:hypothetical protein
LKRYGPRSAINGDGGREAIGSTIATDDAARRTIAHQYPAYMAIDLIQPLVDVVRWASL